MIIYIPSNFKLCVIYDVPHMRSVLTPRLFFFKVLIYLDAHCEVAVNWYAPLVAPISKDR